MIVIEKNRKKKKPQKTKNKKEKQKKTPRFEFGITLSFFLQRIISFSITKFPKNFLSCVRHRNNYLSAVDQMEIGYS